MIKISECVIRKQGGSYAITLPKVFAKDNGLKHGDSIALYRTIADGKDIIVVIPEKHLLAPVTNN